MGSGPGLLFFPTETPASSLARAYEGSSACCWLLWTCPPAMFPFTTSPNRGLVWTCSYTELLDKADEIVLYHAHVYLDKHSVQLLMQVPPDT
jgi:hypothetical protein